MFIFPFKIIYFGQMRIDFTILFRLILMKVLSLIIYEENNHIYIFVSRFNKGIVGL